MKAIKISRLCAAVSLLLVMASSIGFYMYMLKRQNGMDVDCNTIIRYNHLNPDFTATLNLVFRLDKQFAGQVVLSGYINSEGSPETVVSRTIHFGYEVNRLGEISVKNVHYVKKSQDTTSDEIFRQGFFYVPEGTVRQLRINPLLNGWLIENLQSPFALCVNKER